jgi:hypothetical protein
VFCPECWSNEKSILLRHILTSAPARLEFVTTRNYMENLRLWDVMLTLGSDDCFVAKDKHFPILIWMLTTVVRLCSINRHRTVWFSLVLAVKASLWEYERGQLCCVMTSGKIHLLWNESQQSFIRFRIWYWKWTFVLFSINRKKHKRPLWKYTKL